MKNVETYVDSADWHYGTEAAFSDRVLSEKELKRLYDIIVSSGRPKVRVSIEIIEDEKNQVPGDQ